MLKDKQAEKEDKIREKFSILAESFISRLKYHDAATFDIRINVSNGNIGNVYMSMLNEKIF